MRLRRTFTGRLLRRPQAVTSTLHRPGISGAAVSGKAALERAWQAARARNQMIRGPVIARASRSGRNGCQRQRPYRRRIGEPQPGYVDRQVGCPVGLLAGDHRADGAAPCIAGSSYRIDQAGDQGKLFLETNDDVHGNGSGAFTWLVPQYR